MKVNDLSIDALRAEIDDLDAKLLALIAARMSVARRIAVSKGSEPIIYPGREAEILRKILTKVPKELSAQAVVRIWRELISESIRQQGHFEVAICAPERSVAYWDLARNHFGSGAAMRLYESHRQVLGIVSSKPSAIGLLPMPRDNESDPWWVFLGNERAGAVHVVGRLPIIGASKSLGAVIVASIPFDGSTCDCTWLSIETKESMTRDLLLKNLTDSGFQARILATYFAKAESCHYLVEVESTVNRDDLSLKAFEKNLELAISINPIGNYAVPYVGESDWETALG